MESKQMYAWPVTSEAGFTHYINNTSRRRGDDPDDVPVFNKLDLAFTLAYDEHLR